MGTIVYSFYSRNLYNSLFSYSVSYIQLTSLLFYNIIYLQLQNFQLQAPGLRGLKS